MATHFFSRYKNYSIQVTVNDEVKTVNFTPWGEFGHVHIDDSDLEEALMFHSQVIAYSDNWNSWVAPPGKDIVYDNMNISLPPSNEVGNVAQPFGLTSENFPHFLNNLENGDFGKLLGIDGIKLKLFEKYVNVLPMQEDEPIDIGEMIRLSGNTDLTGLVIGKEDTMLQISIFGVAYAKVIDIGIDKNEILYGTLVDDRNVLTINKTESTTQYPLAIYLDEPINENSLAKVFFFGGVSYPIYVMVSELIQSALNP